MNASLVESITILLIKNTTANEVCGQGSLVELDAAIHRKFGPDFPVHCIDDPEVVIFLLCSKNPDSPECKYTQKHAESVDLPLPIFIAVAAGCLLLGIVIAVIFRKAVSASSSYQTFD